MSSFDPRTFEEALADAAEPNPTQAAAVKFLIKPLRVNLFIGFTSEY
jgi:hypothetical protein